MVFEFLKSISQACLPTTPLLLPHPSLHALFKFKSQLCFQLTMFLFIKFSESSLENFKSSLPVTTLIPRCCIIKPCALLERGMN